MAIFIGRVTVTAGIAGRLWNEMDFIVLWLTAVYLKSSSTHSGKECTSCEIDLGGYTAILVVKAWLWRLHLTKSARRAIVGEHRDVERIDTHKHRSRSHWRSATARTLDQPGKRLALTLDSLSLTRVDTLSRCRHSVLFSGLLFLHLILTKSKNCNYLVLCMHSRSIAAR